MAPADHPTREAVGTRKPSSVAAVAADLDVSAQTIYNWREQELIDAVPATRPPSLRTSV
jgi:transposase-like protein